MASFAQNKYCVSCKKNVSTSKQAPTHCPICGGTVALRDWTVRFRIIENGQKKNKRLSGFSTKKDAQNAYAKFLADYTTKNTTIKLTLNFKNILDDYFILDKTQTSPATFYDKKAVFSKFITPQFTNKNLTELEKTDIISWQDWLWTTTKTNGDKLSFKYKSKIRGYFSSFLEYCSERYQIVNYFKHIKTPKNIDTKTEMQIMDLQEFHLFLNQITNDYSLTDYQASLFKTIFMLLFYCGARINEVLALKLTDIDLSAKTITFDKSVSRKFDKQDFPLRTYIIKQTKNSKIRKNILPDNLVKQIKEYLNLNNYKGEVLFGDENPLHDKVVTRAKNKYLAASNLPHMRLHDFRHSHVSFLLHLGVKFSRYCPTNWRHFRCSSKNI